MSTDRLSLSSPAFEGRVRKYDTYIHRPSNTVRHPNPILQNRTVKTSSVSNTQVVAGNKKIISQDTKNYSKNPVRARIAPNLQNQNSQTSTFPNGQMVANPKLIALSSVSRSAQIINQDGTIANQFEDDRRVVYASGKANASKTQKAMYVFGALVFIFAAFTSVQTMFTNKQAQDQIATLGASTDEQGVSEGTGSEPSESEISQGAIAAYQVRNPLDPRYIRIPALGVFARVKNLGIDSKGAVDAPWNIHDAGWYNGSARPGNAVGSSLILGHVSGWTASGVFKNLKNLQPGAQFEIEKGNGEKVNYEVVRSESIPIDQVNMSKILGTEEAGKHDLKIMTCGGKYNRETETYEERVVVYAKHLN